MNTLKCTTVMIVFISIFSCSKDEVSTDHFPTNSQEINNDSEEINGFIFENAQEAIDKSLNEIVDLGDILLIENDILVAPDFFKQEETLTQRHFYTRRVNTPSPIGPTDIRIYFDSSSFPASERGINPNGLEETWNDAVDGAMDRYNLDLSNLKLRFVRTTSMSNADIIVESDNGILPNTTVAAAGFPDWLGNPYDEILINVDFLGLNYDQKLYNMVHEIGHCIGFRHTNMRLRNEGGLANPLWTVTPDAEDPNSVFNGGTALNAWNGFSYYDRRAIEFLY